MVKEVKPLQAEVLRLKSRIKVPPPERTVREKRERAH
jgi:hypothetical protein